MNKTRKITISLAGSLILIAIIAFTPPGRDSHSDSRVIPAPKGKVWEIISDVGNYHQYATGLTGVTIISGSGEGMVRSCSDELGSWQETCTAWNEGTSYSFNVDVGSGFPYPLRTMNGTWSVMNKGDGLSEVIIEFEYQFQFRWMSWIFSEATHQAFDAGNKMLLDNWEKKIVSASLKM